MCTASRITSRPRIGEREVAVALTRGISFGPVVSYRYISVGTAVANDGSGPFDLYAARHGARFLSGGTYYNDAGAPSFESLCL